MEYGVWGTVQGWVTTGMGLEDTTAHHASAGLMNKPSRALRRISGFSEYGNRRGYEGNDLNCKRCYGTSQDGTTGTIH